MLRCYRKYDTETLNRYSKPNFYCGTKSLFYSPKILHRKDLKNTTRILNDYRNNKRPQFQSVTHEVGPQAQMGKNRGTFERYLQSSYCPQLNHSWLTDIKKEQQKDGPYSAIILHV